MFKQLLNALDIELNDDSFVECNGYGSVYIFHQGKETVASIDLRQSIIKSLPLSNEVPF
jgi:hypothetical protein